MAAQYAYTGVVLPKAFLGDLNLEITVPRQLCSRCSATN